MLIPAISIAVCNFCRSRGLTDVVLLLVPPRRPWTRPGGEHERAMADNLARFVPRLAHSAQGQGRLPGAPVRQCCHGALEQRWLRAERAQDNAARDPLRGAARRVHRSGGADSVGDIRNAGAQPRRARGPAKVPIRAVGRAVSARGPFRTATRLLGPCRQTIGGCPERCE